MKETQPIRSNGQQPVRQPVSREALLAGIDRHAGRGANRSEFIETAVRSYLLVLVRRQENLRG